MKCQDFQCSKCSHPAHLPFSLHWSDDDSVALANEKGVYITVVEPYKKFKSPLLRTTRSYIGCSKVCPTENCGIDINELIKDLDQGQMYHLVQDVTLSPVFKNSTYTPSVKQIAWSPVVVKHRLRCLLAVLSDSGLLEICYFSKNKWEAKPTLSTIWFKFCSSTWKETPSDPQEMLQELKQRSYKLKLSAFTWGPVMDGRWYLLLTGSLDGTMVAWRVNQDVETKAICVEMMEELPLLDQCRSTVTALYCHSIAGNQYMIVTCYIDGRITNTVATITSQRVEILEKHTIWKDLDRIQMYPGSLLMKVVGSRLVLVVIKGTFVLVLDVSPSGQMESYEVINSQELFITGLADKLGTEALITAYSGNMYCLDVRDITLFTKVQSSLRGNHYSCNGLALSKSKAIAVMPYSVRTNYDHLTMKDLCHLLWCSVTEHSKLMSIVSEHTGPLSAIWDAIDLLRIESILNMDEDTWSALSNWYGSITAIELDRMEIIKLKKNLAILKILQLVDYQSNKYDKDELATVEEDIQELVMSNYVLQRIRNATLDSLTEFERKSFSLMKKWLEYFIVKHGQKFSHSADSASILFNEFDFEAINPEIESCNICSKEVPTVTSSDCAKCIDGHEVPRCSLSLVQSSFSYYTCFHCGVVAHPDAVSDENNCCIYCDNTFRFIEIV